MPKKDYRQLDALYLPLDKERVKRSRNLRLIPHEPHRVGGKFSYAEWAHVIGIFQSLFFLTLERHRGNHILDIGCGRGLLGIAAEPFVGDGGAYLGIDVSSEAVEFCRQQYPAETHTFQLLEAANPMYAQERESKQQPAWQVEGDSFDLLSALSVWTHLDEPDSIFYFREVSRVLRAGGHAIVTFFIMDEMYRETLDERSDAPSRYHALAQDRWVFDTPAYGSAHWWTPGWAQVPENAIAVTEEGLAQLLEASGLEVVLRHGGNWKERPGLFFQDVLVLRKP